MSFWHVLAFTSLLLVLPSGACAALAVAWVDTAALKPVTTGAAARATLGLQATSPQPLVYVGPGDIAPSCGLLARLGARHLLPMVQASPGELFPACLAVSKTQRFALPGGSGHVFAATQRDTREDVSTVHFFVHQASDGTLAPLEWLNQAELPRALELPALATWAKAQWHAEEAVRQGWTPALAHDVVSGAQFMSLARRVSDGRCRASLGAREQAEPLMQEDWPCTGLLAAAHLAAADASWWLVSSTSPSGPDLHIYRIGRDQVERKRATETRLAPLLPHGCVFQ